MWKPGILLLLLHRINLKCSTFVARAAGEALNVLSCRESAAERKVSFSYLMNRCLHNTAHPTDGSIISSHYGGLGEGRDLCGRTERLTSSPPDRAHRGPLTRVVLQKKPKVEFPFYQVSS